MTPAGSPESCLTESEFEELLPVLAGWSASQQFVGDLVVRDLLGRGIEAEFRVHPLGEDADGHGLAEWTGDRE